MTSNHHDHDSSDSGRTAGGPAGSGGAAASDVVYSTANEERAVAGSAGSISGPAGIRSAETERESANAAWLDDFTIELRLLEVSGSLIGDAVASAGEFLEDSGTTAEESFGSAQRYAAELDLPAVAKAKTNEVLLMSGIGVIGLVVLGQTAFPLAGGDDGLVVRVWLLVSLVAMALILSLIPRAIPVLLRARSRPLVLGMIFAGIVFGGAGPVLLSVWQGQTVLFTVPALPVAIAAGILLVVPAIWNQVRHNLSDDPILEPGAEPDQRPSLGSRLFIVVTNWILVFYGAVSIVLVFVLYPDNQ